MSEDLFGPLIDGDLVERAVIAHLQTWLPVYLAELEERKELAAGALPVPNNWNLVSEDEGSRWPEHQLPSGIVICPGLGAPPIKHGDGSVDATYEVAIAIVVSGRDEHETRRYAHWYAAAVALLMDQKPGMAGTDLEGRVLGVDLLDEEPAGDEKRRTLGSMRQAFSLQLADVRNARMGPAEDAPPIDPDSPYTAETVTVETTDPDD